MSEVKVIIATLVVAYLAAKTLQFVVENLFVDGVEKCLRENFDPYIQEEEK